jgi:hypothetical protein
VIAMARKPRVDEHAAMYDRFLSDGVGTHRFQFGPHVYLGRPVKSWGGIVICEKCESSNWDGIVLEMHPKLAAHLTEIGVTPSLNEKGWLPIPPR